MYLVIQTDLKTVEGPYPITEAQQPPKKGSIHHRIIVKAEEDIISQVEALRDLMSIDRNTCPYNFHIPESVKFRIRVSFLGGDKEEVLRLIIENKIASICDLCDKEKVAMDIASYGVENGYL